MPSSKLEYNLFHDLLTGLPNRRMFLDRLQGAFARVRRESGRNYALLANVDHVKVFNETMGTKSGDHIEGIETVRQLERLVELGCEYGQGYFFSQPMEAKAALIFMRQQIAAVRKSNAGT